MITLLKQNNLPGLKNKTCPTCRSLIEPDWQDLNEGQIKIEWRCSCGYAESVVNNKLLFT